MDNPLSISSHLLDQGRRLFMLGRAGQARRSLRKLLGLPELPNPVRADALTLLGHLEMASQRFRRARRYYSTAIRLRPYDAETYSRYAAAVAADPDADLSKARRALRRAVGISPYESRYWAALGTVSARMGLRRKAGQAFRRAAKLRPQELGTLTEVVEGFASLNLGRQARAALTMARFRAPADAGLRQLDNRLRFELARRGQQAVLGTTEQAPVLPFPGRGAGPAVAGGAPGIVRVDRASRPTPHVLRMFGGGRQAR